MHEAHCFVAATRLVRPHGAARHDQPVILVGRDLRKRLFHRERVTRVDVAVHGLGVSCLEAHDVDRSAFALHGLLRLFELHLLGAYRGQEDCYLLPCNSLATGALLSIDLHSWDTRRKQWLNGRGDCSIKALQIVHERAKISGPSGPRTKVSSALAPSSEGFQAKAWPSLISCCVPGVAMTSRDA